MSEVTKSAVCFHNQQIIQGVGGREKEKNLHAHEKFFLQFCNKETNKKSTNLSPILTKQLQI